MMDARKALAYYVSEAARLEGAATLARRLGLHKNYLHRAMHPNEEHGGVGKRYSPPISENAARLMEDLGLTIAPIDESEPTVGQITALITGMPGSYDAKRVAIAAVHEAGKARLRGDG